MRFFSTRHPVTLAVYFSAVLFAVTLIPNPLLQAEALIGGIMFSCTVFPARRMKRKAGGYLLTAVLVTVTNPIFSHNGTDVLFTVGKLHVTSQSVFYGMGMSLMIVAVILWCDILSTTVTDDKFMYLFGKLVPKLSLTLSCALRTLPVILKRIKKVDGAQKTMGLYNDEKRISAIKSRGEVIRSVISWSLENAMDTSLSMSARGYGLRPRTSFAIFRFGISDCLMTVLTVALAAAAFVGYAKGVLDFEYYPEISFYGFTPGAVSVYVAFMLLSLMPFIIEAGEGLKWKYCVSGT